MTEHGLRPLEPLALPNYKIVSLYTRNTYKGGGAVILALNNIDSVNIDKFTGLTIDKDFELTCAYFTESNLYVINIYRSPSGDVKVFCDNLFNVLNSLCKRSNIVLVGDFNIDKNRNSRSFLELNSILTSFNLKMHIDVFTRITKSSSTIIDYFCTNFESEHINIDVLSNGLSDHEAIIGEIKVQRCNKKIDNVVRFRNCSQKNLKKFKTLLENTDWSFIEEYQSASGKFDAFHNFVMEIANTCFPYKKINKKRKEYITSGIRTSCKNKRCLQYLSKFSKFLLNYYKRYKKY